MAPILFIFKNFMSVFTEIIAVYILHEIAAAKILIIYHKKMKMVIRIVCQQTKIRKKVHQDKLRLLRIDFIYTFTNVLHRPKKLNVLFA